MFQRQFSKFRRVLHTQYKNEVSRCLKQFLNEAKTAGYTVKRLLSDAGKEFDYEAVRKIISDHGITLRIVTPYTPGQNGMSESENRTLVELCKSMLSVSKLSKTVWQQVCETAVYILNTTGKTPITGQAPIELRARQSIQDLSHLRIFGTACYVHILKQFLKKWDNNSVFEHVVGYLNHKVCYQVYIPSSKKII